MAVDLVDNYVDRAGVKGDTEFILSSLREVYAEFKKLESVRVDLRGVTGVVGIAPAMEKAKVGADSLSAATDTVAKRMTVMNGQSKEFTQTLLAQTRAQTEAAKTATESAKSLAAEAKAAEQIAKQKLAELKQQRQNKRSLPPMVMQLKDKKL
jgi:hypothetical protein